MIAVLQCSAEHLTSPAQVDSGLCAGPHRNPRPRPKAKAAPRKNPNPPPPTQKAPLQVDRDTLPRYLGRHSPHLSAVLVCSPGLGPPAYLIAAAADSTRLPTLPQAGFSSSQPATRYCSLHSLHCTASSERVVVVLQFLIPSFAHSNPIQSNPPSSPFTLNQYLPALLAEPQS